MLIEMLEMMIAGECLESTNSVFFIHYATNKLNSQYNSLPTIDPDYNPNNDCFSLSDAGGTIGSQSLANTGFGSATSPRTSAFGSIPGDSYLERSLYNQGYNEPYLQGRNTGIQRQQHQPKEEILDIYAPQGKLGVVIDVPSNSTTPVVHAIKDTCPIRNEIVVGDKLLAVDDENVRGLTAIEVSRLISRKSHQPARKLTVMRAVRSPPPGFGNVKRGHDPRQFGMQY
jgi:hypothetical protein